MADLTPTTATNASALVGPERIPCTQGGLDRALTPSQIRTALESGGGIPLSLSGLSGLSATAQTPAAHASSHLAAGSDAIAGLPIRAILAADFTNNTTTMTSTGLSVAVVSGVRYYFRFSLMLNDSSLGSLGGCKVDFDGSTAAATTFRAWPTDSPSVVAFSGGYTTALATDISGGGFVDDFLVIEGHFRPSSSGTFTLRAAQLVGGDGQITIYEGSSLIVLS